MEKPSIKVPRSEKVLHGNHFLVIAQEKGAYLKDPGLFLISEDGKGNKTSHRIILEPGEGVSVLPHGEGIQVQIYREDQRKKK